MLEYAEFIAALVLLGDISVYLLERSLKLQNRKGSVRHDDKP